MFFFQYLAQAGLFFVVPLYLSICLGLSALATGARLTPLSLTLLATAIGIPRLRPEANPRRVVRLGLAALLLGTVVLLGALDVDSGPEIVLLPMLLIEAGIGALASQLGSVTVSSVRAGLSDLEEYQSEELERLVPQSSCRFFPSSSQAVSDDGDKDQQHDFAHDP